MAALGPFSRPEQMSLDFELVVTFDSRPNEENIFFFHLGTLDGSSHFVFLERNQKCFALKNVFYGDF